LQKCTDWPLTLPKRVEQLMQAHDATLRRISSQHANIWYLEVVAVHPSLQGRGMGGAAMRSVFEHVGGDPIVLECTERSNVRFYEKLGFECVEEVVLIDSSGNDVDEEECRMWVMLMLP
jgi:ribosomal protein S18 acetylase RimI-like enzyme